MNIVAIQDDDIDAIFRDIADIVEIKRASHVEPLIINNKTVWFADMSPVSDPPIKLGPFNTRRAALEAEHKWLMENVL